MSTLELARTIDRASSSHDVRDRILDIAATLLGAALLLVLVSAMFGLAHMTGHFTSMVGSS